MADLNALNAYLDLLHTPASTKPVSLAGNPFDRFDTPQQQQAAAPAVPSQGNPFDQFDQKPAATNGGISAALHGIVHGVTFGLMDPAIAAALSVGQGDDVQYTDSDHTYKTSSAPSYLDRYHENLAAMRSANETNDSNHPVAAFAGNVVGGAALPIGKIASVGDAAMTGARLGFGYGIGQGVTDDQGIDHVVDQGIGGAITGGLTGGVLGKAGDYLSNAVLPKMKAPTIAALKAMSQAAYKRLEDSGVQVSPDALNALGDSAVDKFSQRMGVNINPQVAAAAYPKASAALDLLSAYGTDGSMSGHQASFSDLDQTRRVVADLVGGAQSSDKAMARQVLDHLDNFVGRLGPQDMDTSALDAARANVVSSTGQMGALSKSIQGIEQNQSGALAARGAAGAGTRARYMDLRQSLTDASAARHGALQDMQAESDQISNAPQQAIQDLTDARSLWSRYAKASQLQAIIDKAKNNSTGFSQSGYENSLRSGFRKLLNNDRGIARFSPDERAAIKQVATGGSNLSATNLLRQIGKLSPQGAVPILAEIGMYGAAGPGALAVPAFGLAGRIGATVLQNGAARRAVNLAAMGSDNAAALNAVQLPVPPMRLQAARAASLLPRLTPGLSAFALPAVSSR